MQNTKAHHSPAADAPTSAGVVRRIRKEHDSPEGVATDYVHPHNRATVSVSSPSRFPPSQSGTFSEDQACPKTSSHRNYSPNVLQQT